MHIRITMVAAVAFAVLLPATGQAQETFTIKIKKPAKGVPTHHEKSSTGFEDVKITDNNGNALKSHVKRTTLTEVFDQTILEKPDPKKKPTAIKRTYAKATVKVDDDRKVLPYQGKTVIIENKDGAYRYRYEDGDAIAGDDATFLDREFKDAKKDGETSFESNMLPAKALAVGDSWKIDMAGIIKDVIKEGKMEADVAKATGMGKLLKAYKKDGRQFADIQFKLEMPIKSITISGNPIELQPGAAWGMEITMSACIDGSGLANTTKVETTFNGTALVPAGNPTARLAIATQTNVEGGATELERKK